MKGKRAKTAVLICALCAAGVVAAAERAESETASQQEPCCFENPRFSGTCEVVPGPEETCGDILAYLNNPNSVIHLPCLRINRATWPSWPRFWSDQHLKRPIGDRCRLVS